MRNSLPLTLLVWSLVAVSRLVAAEGDTFAEPRGVSASNRYFEVFGEESLSVQYVAMTGELFAREFSRILSVPTGGSRPVLVSLMPESRGSMTTKFLTRMRPDGRVHLFVSWGQETTREMLERALVQAHLTYLSGVYSNGAVHVPLWLELAGQHFARAEAIPAHAQFLSRQIVDEGPMQLEQILTARRGEFDENQLGPQAYWLFRFLNENSGKRGQFRNFLIRALRGEAPVAALNATYGDQVRSLEEAQLWWTVGVTELIGAPGSPVPGAEESKRRVRELSTFLFVTEAGAVRLFPEDLWDYRTSKTLQSELSRQRTLVRLALGAMHPYYHNAVLSLGRLFDAVLLGDEAQYREALVAFRHDLRTGDELTEETSSILDDLSAELAEP